MAFDAFGEVRIPKPTAKVDDSSFFAELARKQRADDRKLGLGSGSSRVTYKGATTQISAIVLDGSGSQSANFVVPSLGGTYTWVTQTTFIACATTADDAELWVNLLAGSGKGYGYSKQPPSAVGLAGVGVTTAIRAAAGSTATCYVECPLEAGQSGTITFHASPCN